MTWGRAITVSIAGTDYTDDAIDSVEINMGARSPWENNVAGTCRVFLITEDPDVALGDEVIITVDDQTTTPVTLFTGIVSVYSASIYEFGPLWTIAANGPLTRSGRREATATIAASKEGTQIAALARVGLASQWQGTPGTWSAQTRTWAQFDADLTDIDTPGVYELAAIDRVPTNVLRELATSAFSGSGWLYETRNGSIGYADSTRRENTPAAEYLTLPGSVVGRGSFQPTTDEGNLANALEIAYDGGNIEINSTVSMGLYGRWDRQYQTTLVDQDEAVAFAARRLEIESAPRTNLEAGVIIDILNASDNLTDQLLEVERNYGVIVESVPTYIRTSGVFRGFVEGYTWILNPTRPTLNLFVSDYSLSNFGLRWAAAGPTRWNQVGASLTWQDATEDL